MELARTRGLTVADPDVADPVSRDPADDYLVALTGSARLVDLPPRLCRVLTPRR